MSNSRVYWFWHWEDQQGNRFGSTNQLEAEQALQEKPLTSIWAERKVVAEKETAPAGENTVKERRYKRGERGLETMERQYIASERMQRLIQKLNRFYGITGFMPPKFVPVYLSGRLKTCDGLHYSDKIVLEKSVTVTKRYKRDLLWHEIMHSVIHDNYHVLYNDYALHKLQMPSYGSFEKTVFRLGINDGSHNSQNYKLLCECGMWIKTVNKKNMWMCPRCNVRLVSKNEYQKLKRIASIGSATITFDINKYKPWKSNERIA